MLGKLSEAFAKTEKYPDDKEIDKFIRENVYFDRSIRAPMEAQAREIRIEYPGIQVKQLQDSFVTIWRFIIRNKIKTLRQNQLATVENPPKSDQSQMEGVHRNGSEQISNEMPHLLKIRVTQTPNPTPPPQNGSEQAPHLRPQVPQLRLAPIPNAATPQLQNVFRYSPSRIPGIEQIRQSQDLKTPSPLQLPQTRLAPIPRPVPPPESPQIGSHQDLNLPSRLDEIPSQQEQNASPNEADQSPNGSPRRRTPSQSQRTPSVPSQLGLQLERETDPKKHALIDATEDGTRPRKRRGGTYMDPAIQKTLEYWVAWGIVELDDLEDWIDDKRQMTLFRFS